MLGYVTIGTNNIEQARTFYGALLAELGMRELFDNERLYFLAIIRKARLLWSAALMTSKPRASAMA
jgi:catechol 2,3-dioxygenase-like lactoylglutathione lyase family enzyme